MAKINAFLTSPKYISGARGSISNFLQKGTQWRAKQDVS